ncbi:antA/AntB antirepressor family protein [Bartonella jaculi]|uniref:AntA/AntB antirepressor domain-containing protein n=1 Tax=Bartonella jaculi TaxID=686226 RepID=A0ABP9NBT3_9HYPH
MKNFIPTQHTIIQQQIIKTVNARDLHAFLEVKAKFRYWIRKSIKEHGFQEGIDFVASKKQSFPSSRGAPCKNYALTLDAAKHIAICEPSLKSRKIRQYFLECEKKAKAKTDYSNPETLEEFIKHLRKQIKHENVVTTNGVKHA